MCGYIGKISYSSIEQESIEINNKDIVCRGPDENITIHSSFEKLFENKDDLNFSFIFNRLAIVDLGKNSSQPMVNKKKNTILMFNGEIYNHKSLRLEMEKDGIKFISDHSDSEVVLNGLSYYGKTFIDRMIGQFSIAFYNSDNKKLLLLRDRLGQKPLFYSYNNSELIFGSNLISVANVRGKKSLNINSYNEFLNYGVVPSPNTIFEKIFKIKPGHFAEFEFTKSNINVDHKQYWSMEENVSEENFEKDVFNEILSNAISIREQADVPVANFLSGGIDSSYIVKNMFDRGNEVNTFSIVLKDKKYDERKWSREVSKKYNTNHTEVELGLTDFEDNVIDSINFIDEPYADPSTVPSFVISKNISSQYKTSISGDGGDELIGGYKRTNYLLFRNKKIKSFLKYLNYFYPNYYGTGNLFLRNSSNLSEASGSYFSDKNLLNYLNLKDSKKYELSFYKSFDSKYKTLLFSEYSFFLSEMMMLKVDRTSMAHSLEVRSPFVDHRLVEYMFRTSPNYLNDDNPKSLFKNSLMEDFGSEFINRPKQGFVFNIEDWIFANKKMILDNSLEINKLNIFSEKKLNNLFKYKSRINGLRLWKIFLISSYIDRNL
ncbi:asparagine synthase (glutamine-hydrolyzing) [Acidimicrobiaceae bacterium]|nr:asparagine synthase (glutamine-hydrolyzing) [Acidimicrobiaceae bacterium]